jgi:cytochrome c-type biogenesis protein CcmH
MMKRTFAGHGLSCLLLLWAASAAAEPRIAGELAIESKLMAPCCWVQTLDVHESPLSTELRLEIREKLGRGVPAERIEADLVERYGERLWAIPPGHDPRTPLMNVGFGALGLGLLGLFLVARRWRRRGVVQVAAAGGSESRRDELDSRLDEELRALEP